MTFTNIESKKLAPWHDYRIGYCKRGAVRIYGSYKTGYRVVYGESAVTRGAGIAGQFLFNANSLAEVATKLEAIGAD